MERPPTKICDSRPQEIRLKGKPKVETANKARPQMIAMAITDSEWTKQKHHLKGQVPSHPKSFLNFGEVNINMVNT